MMVQRILIAEDERIVAMDLRVTLEAFGYGVLGPVARGRDAIWFAAQERPDLAIVDIVLEGDVDGVEAARSITEELHVPVVYLTAHSDPATLERAKRTEPLGYLLKPFHERELRICVEMAISRHRAEQEHRDRERWLSTLLGSLRDAVLATDAEGRVTLLNPACEELTGWSLAEAAGRYASEVARVRGGGPEGPRGHPVTRALASTEERTDRGHVLVARDGTERAVASRGAPLLDATGRVSGAVLVLRDVTETRRLEREVARAQELETVGELAGGIAHDFNNVLAVIGGNLELLGCRPAPDAEAPRLLADATEACRRAAGLTRQLLTFARGGAPVRTPVRLGELLAEAGGTSLRGSGVELRLSAGDDLWFVEADTDQLGQAVTHLVVNAMQAMPDGGTLDLRACNEVLDEDCPPQLEAGRYVRVEVEDSGPGIPAARRARVFDPFYTTRPQASGLGLATVASIVRQHGGHVRASGGAAGGARFTLWLPAVDQAPAPTEGDRRRAFEAAGRRVLVMDDQPEVRAVLERMLGALGYRPDGVADGAAALAAHGAAAASGAPYELVLLDLTVPGGMGGREAVTRLRARDPDLRAIVVSGYSHDAVASAYREHGFVGRLAKPFRLEQLARVLAEACADQDAPGAGPRPPSTPQRSPV